MNSKLYTVCMVPSCTSCSEIIELLNTMNVKFNIKNLQNNPECEVSIIPALFKGKHLVAYGNDIITYFKKKANKPFYNLQTSNSFS